MSRLRAGLSGALRRRGPGGTTVILIAVIGPAVAALLLSALFGMLNIRDQRADTSASRSILEASNTPHSSKVTVYTGLDAYKTRPLRVVRVVGTTTNPTLTPPGLPHLPGPSEFFASPALARLLTQQAQDGTDPQLLRDRFPAHRAGLINEAGLLDPNELVAYVGLSQAPSASGFQLAGWGGAPVPVALDATRRIGTRIALLTCLLPILSLAVAAGKAGTVRRRRRLTALRLMGFDRRDLLTLACAETAILAGTGVVFGLASEFLLAHLLNSATWLPLQWWPDAFTPSAGQAIISALVPLAIAVTASAIGVRTVAADAVSSAPRSAAAVRRPRMLRLVPLCAVTAAVVLTPHTRHLIWVLLAEVVLLFGAIALSVAPLSHVIAARLAIRAHRFTALYGARRSQRTGAAVRSASALAAGLFLAIISVVLVRNVDEKNGAAERAVNASWPQDTVQSARNLHGDDVARISATPGVGQVFALRVLQGPTGADHQFVTIAFVNCANLASFAGAEQFPQCDNGQAIDVAPAKSSFGPGPATIRRVAEGQVVEGAFNDHGTVGRIPVSLHATTVSTSTRLQAMFADIGVTLLVGEHDVPASVLNVALTPNLYFHASAGAASVDRIRTYIADKYGDGSDVQTLSQRLYAARGDAIAYSHALWAAIIFGLVLSMAVFAIVTVEDLRRRQVTSSAMIAAGVPERTIDISGILAAGVTVLPAVVLAGVLGAYIGHVLLSADNNTAGTPLALISTMAMLAGLAAITVSTVTTLTTARTTMFRPSSLNPE